MQSIWFLNGSINYMTNYKQKWFLLVEHICWAREEVGSIDQSDQFSNDLKGNKLQQSLIEVEKIALRFGEGRLVWKDWCSFYKNSLQHGTD